ncbi:MAG: outer membrane beta-barrel protein [Planctomycetaceae bacterium]
MLKKTLAAMGLGLLMTGLTSAQDSLTGAMNGVFEFSSSDFAEGAPDQSGQQYYPAEEEDEGGIVYGGWLQGGWHSRDASSGAGLQRFNTHAHRWNTHQAWLFVEKVADGSDGLDWGFRVDAMYGVDGADTQAFGNSPGRWDFDNGFDHGQFAFAFPQAYIELASGNWSVKAGHFFTLVGYEVVTAPDNFFYSHAFTMYNSEPFTHTGVLGTYNVNDNVTVYGGWTSGWDTGFDTNNGGSSFLGGVSVGLSEDATATYIATSGNFGTRGNGYGHSIVLDTQLTDNFNYVIQGDYLDTDGVGPLGLLPDRQYGINNYFLYTLSDSLAAGIRYEWWNVSGVSVNDITFGVNIKLRDNLVIRPEVRHDWAPGLDYAETFLGMDSIMTF